MTIDDIHDSIRMCDNLLDESDSEQLKDFLSNVRLVHGRLKEILNHWEDAHLVPHE